MHALAALAGTLWSWARANGVQVPPANIDHSSPYTHTYENAIYNFFQTVDKPVLVTIDEVRGAALAMDPVALEHGVRSVTLWINESCLCHHVTVLKLQLMHNMPMEC